MKRKKVQLKVSRVSQLPGLLTTTQAAKLLGVTPRHVRNLIKSGLLEGKLVARDWLIEAESIANARRRKTKRGPAVRQEKPKKTN
ncbi:MAG: helix-turn-helix domain-containing protein [Acidobacteria bacterium]|nr:helix-turn-helix domain-containing protein [Acidobacteriota bacterium]